MTNQPVAQPETSLVPFGGFGPRAAAVPGDYSIATLVIGLGQVGWHATSLVSNMLSASLAAKDHGRIQYLAIGRRPSVIPEGRLGRENTLLLGIEETNWAHIPGRYSGAGVARWWPKPPRDVSAIPEISDVRAYGRLLLFDNPSLVSETISNRVANLLAQSQSGVGNGRRLIVLVASIAEAEGSAMIFDIAWLLRLQLIEHPTQIIAVLTADTGPIDSERRTLAVANVYATLKELDAVMVNPAQYPMALPVMGSSKHLNTGRISTATDDRPLDYLLLTGDAAKQDDSIIPAAALAELTTTWMLSHVNAPGPDLAPLSPTLAKSQRFDGYTMFNVSKLGLPVAAAIDLIGGNLAQQILTGMGTMRDDPSVEEWAETTLDNFKQALSYNSFFEEHKLRDRLNELLKRATTESIAAEVRSKDKDFSMRGYAESLIKRLEHEDRTVEKIDEGHTEIRLETLRTRAEDTIEEMQNRLAQTIRNLPTLISCQQGNGLQWALVALQQLSRRLNETLNECREQASIADEVYQEARRSALMNSSQHDDSYSGIKRRLRGTAAKDLHELSITFDYVTNCMAERVRWSNSAVALQSIWKLVDSTIDETRAALGQVERMRQQITEYTAGTREAMDAAAQRQATFPVGVIVDGEWFQRGVAQAVPPDIAPRDLITRVFRQWAHQLLHGERRADRFVRDVLAASRQFLLGKFQFDPIANYIVTHANLPQVPQAIVEFQKAAMPQFVPARETSGWATHEWLRAVPAAIKLLPPVSGSPWKRLNVLSPDTDEMAIIRLTHNVSAEMIPQLRGPYRRAYDRVAAEGVPLHLDRRWDATLADLVKDSTQSEISALWEAALNASPKGPVAMREPLIALVRTLAVALGLEPAAVTKVPASAPDFAVTVYPLPTTRLRLPPDQCPVVFCFSSRRPRELGQEIHQALSALGLSEPFVFLVNLNGRKDMDVVAETMINESYNVVELDEARFKRVVSSRKPLSALTEIVLSEVDLTLVSPFYTKAPVPERMFYGREREIKDVRRKIKTHSVALIGGRRIGKTSTLHHIDRLLRAPDSGYTPYYLDCHNAMQYTHFFNSVQRRWGITTPTSDPTTFEDVVAEIQERHPGQNIVFLFDEVDRLLTMDMEQEQSELLFRTFRSLSNEGKAHFIFSGERWLARAMENSYSALFNFALPVRLQPLEKSVVARLVVEPFEIMNIWLEDGPTVINRIYEISAGHPNIVQMICQEMVVAMDANRSNVGLLDGAHLEQALDKHVLQEDIVHTIWGQMSDLARLVTLLWPEDERRMSLDQIVAKIRAAGLVNVSVRDLQEAMKDLELYCFVTPKGREFELVPVAFPALLDFMTVKQMEISATVESIQAKAKKEMFSR